MDKNDTAIRTVAQAPEWWYFARNFSMPGLNTIAMKSYADQGEFAQAAAVFRELKLPIDELREIYRGSVPTDLFPHPDDYEALGGCRVDEIDGWSRLARLSGKIIHLVHRGSEPVGLEIAVYYPDGRIEKVG